jgi:hypothetical protein
MCRCASNATGPVLMLRPRQPQADIVLEYWSRNYQSSSGIHCHVKTISSYHDSMQGRLREQ